MKNLVIVTMLVISFVATTAFTQTTISIPIIDGNDDAEEVKAEIAGESEVLGEVDRGSSDLELIFDHTPQYVGMLFRNVQIPPNATITNAYVQFTVDVVKEGTTDADITVEIYGAKEATVDAITADAFNISAHSQTTAQVSWNPAASVAVGDATEREQTPDISAIIEEIVAQDGWAKGNNILIVITGDANQTEDKNREVESYNGDAAGAPVLNVTFEESAATTISIPIVDGNDDAEEVKTELEPEGPLGAIDRGSSDLEIIFDHEPQYVGMLFRNVQIPPNATIVDAYVQFTVDVVKEGTTDADITVEIYGVKETTVDAITGDPFNISAHPPTDALVIWNPAASVAVGDATEREQTPDISTIIEEIVAQDGWAKGNNILIVITGDANQTEDKNREFESYNGDAAGAPVLNVTFEEGATAVENKKLTPSNYILSQNYPNPFNPRTTIRIDLDKMSSVTIEIFNMLGQNIATLVNAQMSAGTHTVQWNPTADITGGVYLYKLTAGNHSEMRKMLFIK